MTKNIPLGRALRKMILPATIAGLSLTGTPQAHAQFTNGNIVVLQVGDGAAALGSTGTPLILKEFTPQGIAAATVAIPATGPHRLVVSGSATTEGLMTLSADSTRLVIVGYDTTAGTAGVASIPSAFAARAIDTVSILGIPGRADTSRTAFGGSNIRCATRGNAENYWAAGNGSGIYYMGNLAAPGTIAAATTNNRAVLAANGNLYYSTGAGATPGIYKIAGQPIGAGAGAAASMITAAGMSPNGFAINSAETVVYIADDRTVANSGGIQKWVYSGGVWAMAYVLLPPTGVTAGSRSVIADWSGATPALYGTTTDSRLVKYIDGGTAATVAATTLATAPANTAFRSVAFAPKAAPACTKPVFTLTPAAKKCTANGAVSLAVTGGSAPVNFAWTGPGAFTATTQNLSNLATPGNYRVTVSTAGGCSDTASANVLDSTNISVALVAGGPTTVCGGDSVLLTASAGANYSYQFNNAGGAIPGATASTFKAGVSGAYTVTVTSGTCSVTSSPAVTITVNPRPAAVVTPAGPLMVCPGTPVALKTSRTAGFTYEWRRNGVILPGSVDTLFTVRDTAGSYTVTVRNTATTCSTTSSPVVISLHARPDTAVTASGPLSFCSGDSVRLKAVSAANTIYQWRNAMGNIPGASDSVFTAGTSGSYKVVLTTANGCQDSSALRTVVAYTRPGAAFTASADTGCAGAPGGILLTAPAGPGFTYQIDFGDTTLPIPNNSFYLTSFGGFGEYASQSIRLIVTNANGCTDTSALRTFTFYHPQPFIVYNSGTLSTNTPYTSYQWYRNGIALNGATSATFQPMRDGMYNVMVTGGPGCSDSSENAFEISGLGIRTTAVQSSVKVYPNPAANVLNIDSPKPVNIRLRDMQGRVVAEQDHAMRVDISGLAEGVYLLSATDDAGALIQTLRVIKAK